MVSRLPAFSLRSFDLASVVALALLLILVAGGPAQGFLGSFEEQDGYRIPLTAQIVSAGIAGDAQFYLGNNPANGYTGVVPVGAYPNDYGDGDHGWHGADVTRYNAGAYGINGSGPGGTAVDIADNSGQWRALAGGRLNEDADAPYYYGSQLLRDHVVAYHYLYSRTGAQVLSLIAAQDNLSYSYTLDSRDLNGINPASTAASLVQMSFWVLPSDWDDPDTGNIMSLSLYDSANQSIFEVGYTGDNRLQYRLAGSGGAWQTTNLVLGNESWSQITMSVDLAADTASLSLQAYDDTLNGLGTSIDVLMNASMGLDAKDLQGLQFDLRGGTLNDGAASYVHYYDDFNFVVSPGNTTLVPEPGSMVLVGLGLGLWGGGRKRRRCVEWQRPNTVS